MKLIVKGNQLKRQGKIEEAITIYQEAIKLNPSFAFTYYELGDALEKKGDFEKAVVEYEKAIEINPNINFFHQRLQKIKSRKKQESINFTDEPIKSELFIIGISMIKNEEDIIETFVRHNLNYLDFLVLADNGFTDNTRIIIQKMLQEGLNLCVIDDNKMAYTQGQKITNLYRRVGTSFLPEFIIPIDADELIQSPSKQSFINSLQAIPQQGVGLYPWKTYIPEPTFSSHLLSKFKYRRKNENPQYFKIVLRSSGCVNYRLTIAQGCHRVIIENSDVSIVKLLDICLAHFPTRNLNQVMKKILLGWLGYIDKNKSTDSGGQVYQWKDLYYKFMEKKIYFDSDLTYIALNYAQKVQVQENWLNQVELESPIVKVPQLAFTDLIARQDDYTNVVRTIIKAWENQIIKSYNVISREDLISFSQSPTVQAIDNQENGIFDPNFHLEKLFVDIPPFKYIYERFLPESILDIGCGLGAYLRLFNKLGVKEIIGVDGFTPEESFLNLNQYIRHDLTHPLDLQRKFDLVMCLEVAEHLPPGSEVNLLEILNNHADNILIFSAGEKGQPGHGHINCKSFEEWANLLHHYNWSPMIAETLFLRCISSFSWFRRNPIVLKKQKPHSENIDLQSWDKLITISQTPYKWYSQKPQIIAEMLEVDIPDDVYPSWIESSEL